MNSRTQSFDPRQSMRSQSFEIFHYQDPKPNSVEMHHHDFYEVYCFLGGNVQYRVEGRIYRMEPGDLLLINPMELHQPIMEPGGTVYERIVLWINRSYLEHFTNGAEGLDRCFDSALPSHSNHLRPTAVQRQQMTQLLQQLVQEYHGSDYAGTLCSTGIFLQFMTMLNRLALHSDSGQQTGPATLAEQVLEYINEHHSEDLSLEGLAEQFYVSKYHLSHEFSKAVGTGVYRYITLKRLQIAKQLLSDGVPPGAVYSRCGFGDYANFYRAFKARYGISPREGCAAQQP